MKQNYLLNNKPLHARLKHLDPGTTKRPCPTFIVLFSSRSKVFTENLRCTFLFVVCKCVACVHSDITESCNIQMNTLLLYYC